MVAGSTCLPGSEVLVPSAPAGMLDPLPRADPVRLGQRIALVPAAGAAGDGGHQQRRRFCQCFFFLLQFTLQLAIPPDQFLILALQFPLISHARRAGAIGILGGLAPTGNLLGIQPPLPAERPELGSVQSCGLDHGCQLVGSAPLLRRPVRGRHQLALLLPLAPPVVDGLRRDPGVAGDLSHALTVRRAHPQADGFPQSGVIGRLHSRRLGPQVDGSNRADFFADTGGPD